MSESYFIEPANGRVRPIVRIARSLGIEVVRCSTEGLQGAKAILCRTNSKYCIRSAEELTLPERRLSIAHELAHAILGHLLYEENESYRVSPEQAEFEAESLGFILYNFLYGIDGGRKTWE